MEFQWLSMRIAEERDRREREALVRARLPLAMADLFESLRECVAAYSEAFGEKAAEIAMEGSQAHVTVREQGAAGWEPKTRIELRPVPELPGFRILGAGEPVEIEVGILPGGNVFYKRRETYLTLEQLTRQILDRGFFPKLGE